MAKIQIVLFSLLMILINDFPLKIANKHFLRNINQKTTILPM